MANHSCRNRQRAAAAPAAAVPSEPPVHRWPHPIAQPLAAAPAETTLQYICCSLSYQNQLLSEIKTLLERVVITQTDRKDQ